LTIAPYLRDVLNIAKHLNNNSLQRGRSGWVYRKVSNPESIYEHCCKVGLSSYYLFGDKDYLERGLVHDFPEIFEKDFMPGERDTKIKRELEEVSMNKVSIYLPNGDKWYRRWEEFENDKNLKELDKACPVIQILDYKKSQDLDILEEFYNYAQNKIKSNFLSNLLEKICSKDLSKYESAYDYYFQRLKEIKI
jgi:5'-deoxynucleotidase YfbR-like HD superfamily hydrolase